MKTLQALLAIAAIVSLSACASTKKEECTSCCSPGAKASCDVKH